MQDIGFINNKLTRMRQQEEERLIKEAPAEQAASPVKQMSEIHAVRVKKQLQFLKNYQYSSEPGPEGQLITIYDLWNDIHKSVVREKSLQIFLPSMYPFMEPSFRLQGGEKMLVSQLMDQWTPRYKLMEMIELLKQRIEQRQKLKLELKDNTIFGIFTPFHSFWIVALFCIIVRILVGLGSYSGKGDWPNLGDFEAHRNWMSITLNRPINQWYLEDTESEPWWRIDYPPVAAYLSLFFAHIYNHIEPQAMKLQYGYQSPSLTAFMRATVLFIDCLILLPALYLLNKKLSLTRYRNSSIYLASIAVIMLRPDQILIDHGHFQYNSLMLGLILMSFYCMVEGKTYICCFLFTLAINCKLMSTYYCLGFLAGLVGLAGRRKSLKNNKVQFLMQLGMYGAIVIGTTVLLWIPWMNSWQEFKNVVSAIFPVHRGLYQLKVPNFWCITDVIMKWQNWLSKGMLTILCGVACVILSIPSMLALFIRPSNKILIVGFSTIAMTFFMFSYHVHQKSILVPLAMIPFTARYFGGWLSTELTLAGCMGMYHLLAEDGQIVSYFVVLGMFIFLSTGYNTCQQHFIKIYQPHTLENPNQPYSDKTSPFTTSIHNKLYNNNILFRIIIYSVFVFLHVGQFLIAPPQSLPYLWNLLFAFYSFCFNAYFLVIGNSMMIQEINFVRRTFKRQ